MAFADQLGFSFRPPERRVWTVRDLVAAVRTHIEREYGDTWVEGEISNFRAHDSGHLYFTLKDANSQLNAVMFRSQARLLRFRPENGMQVVVRGRITIYEDRGQLQISAEYLEPKGAGALQVAFEQLRIKLEAEGLIRRRAQETNSRPARANWHRDLPAGGCAARHPEHSAAAASQRQRADFSRAGAGGEARRRRCAPEFVISITNSSVDVIIVARGGGSAEDLAAFNDEDWRGRPLIRRFRLISAVGHETDFTILDFVADLRAPTPSAAAELVIRSTRGD